MKKINNRVLDYALSAKGFNNWENLIESGEKFFIQNYLANKSTRLCLDIGANKGDFTRVLLEETDSKVIAFEPLPFKFEEMVQNLSKFQDRCTLINKGVGAKTETLTIHYNEERSEHASFSQEVKNVEYVVNSNTLDIGVTSLDDFCKLNQIVEIDFIKIDTEGFEIEVFEGAQEIFKWSNQSLFKLNTTGINFGHHFIIFQKPPNYEVYQLTDGMSKVDPKHPLANIYIFSNFVFIRKDII